jgi:hypothetical protein
MVGKVRYFEVVQNDAKYITKHQCGRDEFMITLSDDEVVLIRSLLTALRAIKVRDIDKALVILSKNDRGGN